MRLSKPLNYDSLVQALGRGGCVICSFLRNHQAELLQAAPSPDLGSLCNYHGWVLAAGGDGEKAARTFLRMLEANTVSTDTTSCDVCASLRDEESTRLSELAALLERNFVRNWMDAHGGLCSYHAGLTASRLPDAQKSAVLAMQQKQAATLKSELNAFLSQLKVESHSGGGVLGRAAEFLFGQRGVSQWKAKR